MDLVWALFFQFKRQESAKSLPHHICLPKQWTIPSQTGGFSSIRIKLPRGILYSLRHSAFYSLQFEYG